MTYRDRNLSCPHCGGVLDRPSPRRETWPCKQCNGVAIHHDELHRMLSRFAPDLVPADRPIALEPRPATRTRSCPACNLGMAEVSVVGVAVDHCTKDHLVWFDPQELEQTIHAVIADVEARKGWAQKLRELLFAS